jgi:hypothetical protein
MRQKARYFSRKGIVKPPGCWPAPKPIDVLVWRHAAPTGPRTTDTTALMLESDGVDRGFWYGTSCQQALAAQLDLHFVGTPKVDHSCIIRRIEQVRVSVMACDLTDARLWKALRPQSVDLIDKSAGAVIAQASQQKELGGLLLPALVPAGAFVLVVFAHRAERIAIVESWTGRLSDLSPASTRQAVDR